MINYIINELKSEQVNKILIPIYTILIYIFYTAQGFDFYNKFFNVVLLIALFISGIVLLFNILRNRKSIINIQVILVGLLFCCATAYTKDTRSIVFFISMLVYKEYNLYTFFRMLLCIKLSLLILFLVIGNFNHVNTFAMEIGTIILLILINFENIINKKIIYQLVLFSLVLITYYFLRSETFLIISFLAMILFLTKDRWFPYIKKIHITSYIYIVIMIINLVLCFSYTYLEKNAVINIIDKIASGRIGLGSFSLNFFGFSLLGNNIDYSLLDSSIKYFNLDSGYLWLFQNWGIIFTIFFMYLTKKHMDKLISLDNKSLIIVALSIAIWAFSEDILLSINFNFILVTYYSKNKIFIK